MSRSVDLFIDFRGSPEELAALLSERTGRPVSPGPAEGTFVLTDGELAATAGRHGYVDDDELPLARYPYVLSLRTSTAGPLGASAETVSLRAVADALGDLPVLLVLDLQYRDAGRPDDGAAVTR
jgi:hypothetical protein